MSKNTKIEWADHTFNPWIGCTRVATGCDNCYAKTEWEDRRHRVVWGAGQARSRTKTWGDPVRWDKEHAAFFAEHGRRQRVFCASLADVFDNDVDPQWRVDLLRLIAETPHLDWLLLTKRIGNANQMMIDAFRSGWPNHEAIWERWTELFKNIWLGVTICTQEEANRDIPKLLSIPAAKRFLSMEPLLGVVELDPLWLRPSPSAAFVAGKVTWDMPAWTRIGCIGLDWVIVGGESGPNARPMHPDWARSLRDQCQEFGVPFFFKQWGSYAPWIWFDGPDSESDQCFDDFLDLERVQHHFLAADGRTWDTNGGRYMYPPLPLGHWCLMVNVGKKSAGRLLDGHEWNEVPR